MHGVKRIRQTPQALEAKKQKEQAKIQEFLALSEDVLRRRKNSDVSEPAFQLTTRLLQVNPEFYTIWNYRRNILQKGLFIDCSPEKIHSCLVDELAMTMSALKTHPKVYWIWNHRRWCLENIPNGSTPNGADGWKGWKKTAWDRELFVVEKMLDADPRNFHAWDYRRYVLASMPTPRQETLELGYTSRKIEANFSNFSAWHQRSKILAALWDSGKLDEEKSKVEGGQVPKASNPGTHMALEFELVRNAMYTDPNDQSVWVYHRWLVGSRADKELLDREIRAIEELLEEQPDSKWCMESIVHYTRMLLKQCSSGIDSAGLPDKCQGLLKELEVIDPSRRKRYQDLGLSAWVKSS